MRLIEGEPSDLMNGGLTIMAGERTSAGGAPTYYEIRSIEPQPMGIRFCTRAGSPADGVTNEAMVLIVQDRLQCFQQGPHPCLENDQALAHLGEALHWLRCRAARVKTERADGSPEAQPVPQLDQAAAATASQAHSTPVGQIRGEDGVIRNISDGRPVPGDVAELLDHCDALPVEDIDRLGVSTDGQHVTLFLDNKTYRPDLLPIQVVKTAVGLKKRLEDLARLNQEAVNELAKVAGVRNRLVADKEAVHALVLEHQEKLRIGLASASLAERVRHVIHEYHHKAVESLGQAKAFRDDVLIWLRAMSICVTMVGNAHTHKEKAARLRGLVEVIEGRCAKLREMSFDIAFASGGRWPFEDVFASDYPSRYYIGRIQDCSGRSSPSRLHSRAGLRSRGTTRTSRSLYEGASAVDAPGGRSV